MLFLYNNPIIPLKFQEQPQIESNHWNNVTSVNANCMELMLQSDVGCISLLPLQLMLKQSWDFNQKKNNGNVI